MRERLARKAVVCGIRKKMASFQGGTFNHDFILDHYSIRISNEHVASARADVGRSKQKKREQASDNEHVLQRRAPVTMGVQRGDGERGHGGAGGQRVEAGVVDVVGVKRGVDGHRARQRPRTRDGRDRRTLKHRRPAVSAVGVVREGIEKRRKRFG